MSRHGGRTTPTTEDEEEVKPSKVSGFVLEFDAARKIAQGLGIHLEKSPSIVEVKGDKARLLPVAERTKYLFGKEAADAPTTKKKPKKKDTQLSLFEALKEADAELSADEPELKAPKAGSTVLDRVHQAMILFAAGRSRPSRASSSMRALARTPGSGSLPSRSPPSTRRASTRSAGSMACWRARPRAANTSP